MNNSRADRAAKTRKRVRRTRLDAPERNVFRGTVTLDPAGVQDAWDRLSMNTHAVEIGALPARLHRGLVHALKTWKRHNTSNGQRRR